MHPELCFGGGASTVTLSTNDAAAVFVHTLSVALPEAVLLKKSCVMALVLACGSVDPMDMSGRNTRMRYIVNYTSQIEHPQKSRDP